MGNIIWLASYQKSGSTWVRAFLHNLFLNADAPLALPETRGGEISASASSLHWYRGLDKRDPQNWSTRDVAMMRPRVQEMIAKSRSGSVFCKTHLPLIKLYDQPTINMSATAGAIYIVRDPRDVVISFADFHGIPIDRAIVWLGEKNLEVPASERQVSEPMGSWTLHVKSWTANPSPAIHIMRYEDLHKDTRKSFDDLAKFLGLDVKPDRMERAIKNTSFKTLRALEDKHGFDERSPSQDRFFRRGIAGGWRDALTPEQARQIEEDHGEQMKCFGYEASQP